jgi:hypothetical protein
LAFAPAPKHRWPSARLLPAVCALLACASPPRERSAVATCTPFDQYGEVLLRGARRFHTDTSRVYAEARARGNRPVVPPDRIRYVTDEDVCRRVATVVAAAEARKGRISGGRVRVVREGDRYVATDFPFERYQLERTPNGGIVPDHAGGVSTTSPRRSRSSRATGCEPPGLGHRIAGAPGAPCGPAAAARDCTVRPRAGRSATRGCGRADARRATRRAERG